MSAVSFKNVDIIFGDQPHLALELVEQHLSRDEILEKTGQVLGVADVSLDVMPGEICVLMGLSGSGKSTLIRAVNALNKVVRGKVLVNENGNQIDVASCDQNTLRELRMHKISMVFQQFALLPWRTVKENVGLGLELQGVAAAERDSRVMEKLQMVGLDNWADKYAHELSGGMQQRVGLARAFVTDADILLMDEPFSALDPLIRDRLQDELLELQASLNKTIIFVSHDLDEALKIGSRIAIMESGRVIQYSKPEDIVLNPVNQYVADFVAHMNPLNVLRGKTLIKPISEFPSNNNEIEIDPERNIIISLNVENKLIKAVKNGHELLVRSAKELLKENSFPNNAVLAIAEPEMKMKDIIKLKYQTGHPVGMAESDKLIGIIGDNEIYEGILKQSALLE